MTAAVSETTAEILTRRRRTAVVRRRGWLVRRLLVVADILGLASAILLAESLVDVDATGAVGVHGEVFLFLASLPAWLFVARLYGLYERDEEHADHSTVDELVGVFHMVTVCTAAFGVGAWLTGVARPQPLKLVVFWAAAIVFVSLGRAAARAFARRRVTYLQNALIVGAGDVGQLYAKKLLLHPEYGINVVGFVDRDPKEPQDGLAGLTILGGPSTSRRSFVCSTSSASSSRSRTSHTRSCSSLSPPSEISMSRSTSCRASSRPSARGLRSTRLKACPSSGSAPSECAGPRCSSSALWTWAPRLPY